MSGGRDPDLHGLLAFFREWRDFCEYGVIQRQVWNGRTIDKKTLAVKCSKRGNDVYRSRVAKRFGVLERLCCGGRDVEFFGFQDSNPKVRLVFVTLTWVGSGSISDSWEVVGEHFNRWITRIRQKFGRVSYARCWESTQRGYPHVHLMVFLHETQLHGFKTLDQQGNFIWRLEEKSEFESSWEAFVDVRAVRTYSSVIRYLRKRSMFGTDKGNVDDGDVTLSLCWIFRKRSFAMSKDLVSAMADWIHSLHKSKCQSRLDGGFVQETWVWIGVFSAVELNLDGSVWSAELVGPPTCRHNYS